MIADAAQRSAALDVTRSCIVQAPAGSGKTELLIQRMLALLARVERPQQVLAITFTNKAAAEMRHRLLDALHQVQQGKIPDSDHESLTSQLARAVLDRHGEKILKNPVQLAIQTIDSFNAALVRKMPWLSRFGSPPEMSENADELYRAAVENLLAKLTRYPGGEHPLRLLLQHLDNQVVLVEQMLIDLLRRRDQWLRYLHVNNRTSHEHLQQALEALYAEKLEQVKESFPHDLETELLFCLRYAAEHLPDSRLSFLIDMKILPGTRYEDLEAWSAIADLILTGTGDFRKTVNKNNGFPAGNEGKEAKDRMLELLDALRSFPQFGRSLSRIRRLPMGGYSNNQWILLEALIEILPLLIVELWKVFKNRGEADFSEIALKANEALGKADNPSELLLRIDQDLQHILVDEFQDTSRLQYQLIDTLTSGWTTGDGRTLFLVGDPMQSIYLFREAEVGLFLHSFKGRFGTAGLPLEPLQLQCNFRSQQGIVDWVNAGFRRIFPETGDEAVGAVTMAEAVAVKPALPNRACTIHPMIGRDDIAEAEKIVTLIRQAAAEDPDQSIAVLVRGRNHLYELLPLLKKHRIPFQARDVDLLGARPAALDLVNLTRALLHRGDRLSWLAVLRAPWCGLTLNDLQSLVGKDSRSLLPTLLKSPESRVGLSDDGRQRLDRVWPVLELGMSKRGRLPLRDLVEGCWLALGGASCYENEDIADAQQVFTLLETLDEGGNLPDFTQLEKGLERIFSIPEPSDTKLQVMTIHKAKGLEFDTVILPGLGKATGRSNSPLLRWHEHPHHGLLVAPVSAKGDQDKDPVYQLIAEIEAQKEYHETARLLYVAATRAIRCLHLIGHVNETSDGQLSVQKGSLLEQLWPVVEEDYRQYGQASETDPGHFIPPRLKRLPLSWALPESSPAIVPRSQNEGTASDHDDSEQSPFSGWENPAHRHVGTLVHAQLEHITRKGVHYWSSCDARKKEERIGGNLRNLGVPDSEVSASIAKVCEAVDKTLASSRGQWLLQEHHEHTCELPLTGLIDGQLFRAVIDRTFVYEGTRWIVDYKTSSPGPDEPYDRFLQREAERYRPQIEIYSRLFAAHNEPLTLRAALYFPLIDGWYEFDMLE